MRKLPLLLPSILVLLLCLPLAVAAEDEPQPEAQSLESQAVVQPVSEVGRYQLFDSQFSVASLKGPELSEKNLFRIDTVTGTVWIGKQAQYIDRKSGKVIQQRYWEPFEQYLEGQAPAPAGR